MRAKCSVLRLKYRKASTSISKNRLRRLGSKKQALFMDTGSKCYTFWERDPRRYIKSAVLGYSRDTVDTADTADTAENPLILGVGNNTAADTADTAQI